MGTDSDPRGLYNRGLKRLGTDKVAGRMTPSKVADAFGQQFLGLLWEPLDPNDLKAIGERYGELKRVIAGINDCQCKDLLARLQRGGDLYKDFEYRLRRQTRKGLRDLLAERAKKCPATVPMYFLPPAIFNTARPKPPPPPPPPPPKPPTPTPTPTPAPTPQGPNANFEVKRKWETKDYELFSFRFAKLTWKIEIELSGTAKAHPGAPVLQMSGDKDGWYSSVEQEFESEYLGEGSIEIEFPKGKKPKVTAKKKLEWGGAEIEPFLSSDPEELAGVEIPMSEIEFNTEVDEVEIETKAELKLVLAFKLDWVEIIEEALKKGARKVIDKLIDELFAWLGSALASTVGRYLLLALGLDFLWRLVHGGSADPISKPRAKDIKGFKDILDYAASGGDPKKVEAKLLEMDAEVRHSFASAYGGMLDMLTKPYWESTLAKQLGAVVGGAYGFYKAPNTAGSKKDWQDWAETNAGKSQAIQIVLGTESWQGRFRGAELAILWASAAHQRGKLSYHDFKSVRGNANWQATAAGFGCALHRVLSVIQQNTYTLVSKGKKTKFDGKAQWRAIAKLVSIYKDQNKTATKDGHQLELLMGIAGIDELNAVEK